MLTTPIVRCVKNQLKCELHYLITKKFSDVLNKNPYIDQLHFYEDNFNEIKEIIKDQKFDIIIDLHKSRMSRLLTWNLKAKLFSFDKLNIEKWLYVNFKINRLPNKHIVDRYFEGIKTLGVLNDGHGLDYFIEQENELFSHLPSSYNVLTLGAAHFTKRIPLELARKIIIKSELPIVLLGGNDVATEGIELENEFENCINLVSKSNLNQSAVVLSKANLVYTSDTGLMHIAAALQKPIIIFWGNTLPAFGMFPYFGNESGLKSDSREVLGLSCRPCSKLGHKSCPKGHFRCMMNQKV